MQTLLNEPDCSCTRGPSEASVDLGLGKLGKFILLEKGLLQMFAPESGLWEPKKNEEKILENISIFQIRTS